MKGFFTFTILLTVLIIIFLQATCELPRNLFGAQIDPLPALMLATALRAPLFGITALAILGPLWQSSLSSDPLGINILPLFALGLLVQMGQNRLAYHAAGPRFALGAIAGGALPVMTLTLLLFAGHQPMFGWYSLWQWVVGVIGNGLLALLFVPLLEWLDFTVEEQPLAAPYDTTTQIIRNPHG